MCNDFRIGPLRSIDFSQSIYKVWKTSRQRVVAHIKIKDQTNQIDINRFLIGVFRRRGRWISSGQHSERTTCDFSANKQLLIKKTKVKFINKCSDLKLVNR